MSVRLKDISFQVKTSSLAVKDVSFQVYGCVFLHDITFEITDEIISTSEKGFSKNNKIISKNNKILTKLTI